MTDYRRPLALVLPGLLPWTVVTWPTGFYLVFAFGWTGQGFRGFQALPTVAAATGGTTVPWVVGTLLYCLALVSAALSLVDREDRRVTAGLLYFAGASVVVFSLRLSGQSGILAIPLGVLTLWLSATYVYRDRFPWASAVVGRLGAGQK